MHYFSTFIYALLLLTTPSLLIYPQAYVPEITYQASATTQGTLSYNDILRLLDEIEGDELEKRCSQADLERINQFLAMLAEQGVLPDDIEVEHHRRLKESR